MFSSQNSQVSEAFNYIEDVFSTYLYTGNGSTQTITNNIDLAGKGGLTWIKSRSDAYVHCLTDTVRGAGNSLETSSTSANDYSITRVSNFNTDGFTMGGNARTNATSSTYVSWTFREQPKFFDIVTWTGNGTLNREVADVGYEIGMAFVKATSTTSDWFVGHRSLAVTGPNNGLKLNSSQAYTYGGLGPGLEDIWLNANRNGSLVVSSGGSTNTNGVTYVAYIFAHNAGGFGLTGNDNVISCGTFTTDGTGAAGNITLGYESQLVMFKRSDGVGNWQIVDIMRGSSLTSYNYISPTVSNAESSSTSTQGIYPTATGFYVGNNFPGANQTYVYMAIRRGPMKVPTLGTSVFSPVTYTGDGSNPRTITTGIKTDLIIGGDRGANGVGAGYTNDRLRGQANLDTTATGAEGVNVAYPKFDLMTGYTNLATGGAFNATGFSYIRWAFQRAPGFFDEVCYTGTGVARTVAHNLGVVPELMIVKIRSSSDFWVVYSASTGAGYYLGLNYSDPKNPNTQMWDNTTPTSSVFSLNNSSTNNSGSTFVAYLFATCLGVSKVGSYTGNGSSQTIACGFTTGARFVMIKRTDASGDWYVWDTARGIVSGNDPHLSLNTTAAEVTTDDTIDPDNSGFIVNQVAATNVNVSSATYIFLAIA